MPYLKHVHQRLADAAVCGWFDPDFGFVFYSDSRLCLHQFDLCLDRSVVFIPELFLHCVFQFR